MCASASRYSTDVNRRPTGIHEVELGKTPLLRPGGGLDGDLSRHDAVRPPDLRPREDDCPVIESDVADPRGIKGIEMRRNRRSGAFAWSRGITSTPGESVRMLQSIAS